MRRPDDGLLEPEMVETLEAIDATLAGEPVDPQFADVAELSLLLSAGRPRAEIDFVRSLDERVRARFAQAPAESRRVRAWLSSWSTGTVAGASAGALAAAVAVVVLVSGGGGGQKSMPLETATQGAAASAAAPGAGTRSLPGLPPDAKLPSPPAAGSNLKAAGAGATSESLRPPANGRQIIQSATLYLGASPAHIDDVAQQVFNVIGSVNGIVDHSSVTSTGGTDGNAQFALRVPSASLAQTMSALSRLRYASVVSRTDNIQDVNTPFVDANRQLADASALRTALLKQLANATSSQQIASLKAQIAAAEATIASARATLRSLSRQVDNSRINLTIQASSSSGAPSSGGTFNLHRAAHDALGVLTIAAGVALIALAVLVPAGLLGVLAWWTVTTVRRRRREQALDLA